MRTPDLAVRALLGALLLAGASHVGAQNAAVTVTVDANANRRPISPYIYGTAYGTAATLADLNSPLNRYGGNNSSRYNWQQNADNRGFDWYFESIGDASATPGERGDAFIAASRSAGAQPMITVPMIDWVAKVGASRSKLASFSQGKYGAQTGNDSQWYPDAGNGILKSTGAAITGNDPNDANVPNVASMQQSWVQHLVGTWGTAAAGGLRYYLLDNEPSIWHSTHRDVHPAGAAMDEIRNKMIAFASAIKNADPRRWSSARRNGGGAATSTAATTSSTAPRITGAAFPTASRTAVGIICPGCSTRCARTSLRPAGACWTFSPCTITRKAESSATTRPRRCSCCATVLRARSGTPPTSIPPGSTTR